MNRYIIEALSAITFLAIFDLLISKSNNGKLVKVVISLISVTILAVPIVSIVKNFSISTNEYFADLEYAEYLLNIEKKVCQNKVEKALNSDDIEYKNVILEFEQKDGFYNLNKITIKLLKTVINGSEEHINMLERVNLTLKTIINLNEVEIVIE